MDAVEVAASPLVPAARLCLFIGRNRKYTVFIGWNKK